MLFLNFPQRSKCFGSILILKQSIHLLWQSFIVIKIQNIIQIWKRWIINSFNRLRYFCQVPCQFHFQNDYFLPWLSWAFIGPELAFIGTILMNLSKSYDHLSHDLLIAKFGGYGLGRSRLRLLMDHFNSFKQWTKVGSPYNIWSEIKRGILQGSIFGPLLFNIFISDLFFAIEKFDICNFADDNTLYSCGANFKTVLENLEHGTKLLYWFKINSMKVNPEKFQFMILSKKSYQPEKLFVNTFTIFHQF